ncbi:hypothetical protein ACFWWM_23755 [Streptomyces sp. NPDC058682]|nr:hypothetical protein [Streptomyces sp. NBC_01214]MCX4808520.1 hypothetical protein [Streptomyces sp. NBC_01214]
MTKADVLPEAIEAYLGEDDAQDLDSDNPSWTLVAALRRPRPSRATRP